MAAHCASAVLALEKTVAFAAANLQAHQNSLLSLESALLNIHTSSGAAKPSDLETEPSVYEACNGVVSLIEDDPSLERQISDARARINVLQSKNRELAGDLHDWRAHHDILQASVQHLEAHHRSLSALVSLQRALSSPLRRIPLEVWTKIFQHFVSSHYTSETYTNTSRPFYLAGVCTLWRQIVLSTPELWVRFEIKSPPRYEGSWTRRLQAFVEIVERQNASKISRQLDMSLQPLPKNVAWDCHRWPIAHGRYFNSVVFNLDEPYPVPRTYSTVFGGIQSLTLHRTHNEDSEYNELWNALIQYHFVQRLTLHNIGPRYLSAVYSLSHLTFLRLHYTRCWVPWMVKSLLVPSLEELDIRHPENKSIVARPSTLSLLNLQSLLIPLVEYHFLSLLTAPKVRKLTLYPSPIESDSFIEQVIPVIMSTLHRTTHLTLIEWDNKMPNIGCTTVAAYLIEALPKLRALRFEECAITKEGITPLLVCKGLEQLELTFAYCTDLRRTDCETLRSKVAKLNVYI